jgi:hypothetical protein
LVAAQLGNVDAMLRYGALLDQTDPERFFWLGTAARTGNTWSFLEEMSEQIDKFNSGSGQANVIYAIGRALKGHIFNEKGTMFGNDYMYGHHIGAANQVLHFYEFQLQSYRNAVDTWTLVGFRNKVVKDIRKMIGKLIWDAREEAKYSVQKTSPRLE